MISLVVTESVDIKFNFKYGLIQLKQQSDINTNFNVLMIFESKVRYSNMLNRAYSFITKKIMRSFNIALEGGINNSNWHSMKIYRYRLTQDTFKSFSQNMQYTYNILLGIKNVEDLFVVNWPTETHQFNIKVKFFDAWNIVSSQKLFQV